MAYDPALSSPADTVRVLLGDIGATETWPDATINALLALNSNPYLVAATLAESMAAQTAGMVDTIIDGLSVSVSDKTKAWMALAQRLRMGATGGGAIGAGLGAAAPIVGGVSLGDMAARDSDPDRTPSAFRANMMNDPAAGSGIAE